MTSYPRYSSSFQTFKQAQAQIKRFKATFVELFREFPSNFSSIQNRYEKVGQLVSLGPGANKIISL